MRGGTWRVRKPLKPEAALKAQIRTLARLKGWVYFPILQGIGSLPGAPDLMLGVKGKWIAVECKAPKGKMSDAQLQLQLSCAVQAAPYVVVRDVQHLLNYLGEGSWGTLGRRPT